MKIFEVEVFLILFVLFSKEKTDLTPGRRKAALAEKCPSHERLNKSVHPVCSQVAKRVF